MVAVTPERIAKVHAHVADVVARTSEHSALPGREQDRLLAQACTEVCDLLGDWLASEDWSGLRPRNSVRVTNALPRREDYAEFLDQLLADALTRARQAAGTASPAVSLVAEARAAVERTAGRHLRWTQRDLFNTADRRVQELRAEVCQLVGDLRSTVTAGPTADARRRRARTALMKGIGMLPALVLAIGGVSPAQMEANLTAWGHDAVRVVTIYLIAEQAQPDMLIEPPRLEAQIESPQLDEPELDPEAQLDEPELEAEL